ncbi:hypothetical protein D3C84_636170 [compost metagenome]
MGDIRVAAVDAAGADDADRRLLRLHGAHLHRRGVGAQQHVRVEIEGVVHCPGRVVAGNVERFEVVVVVFDLGAFGDAVANAGEELLDALQGAGNRVQATGGLAAARQGHVDTLGRELGGQCCLLKRLFAGVQGVLNALLGGIDQGADLGTLLCRQVAQGLHHLGQLALLAKVVNANLLQGIHVFGLLHGL